MTSAPKKLMFRGVNLALKDPIETLNPERLSALTKDELAAYLYYYGMCTISTLSDLIQSRKLTFSIRCISLLICSLQDVEPSSYDTKPELKKQVRNLVASIKDGTVPKRDGIGRDLRKSESVKVYGSLAVQNVLSSMKTPSSLQIPHAPAPITPLRSPFSISGAQASISKHVGSGSSHLVLPAPSKHVSVVDQSLMSDRPSILDEGLEFQVSDFVSPLSAQKLDKAFPDVQYRSFHYYYSLIDRLEHMEPAKRQHLPPRSSDASSSRLASDTICASCGKRSLRSCRFRRCRTCCNAYTAPSSSASIPSVSISVPPVEPDSSSVGSALLDGRLQRHCEVHSVGQDLLFSPSPRPLDRSGAVAPISSFVSTSSKSVKKAIPTVPKPTQAVLGETEATNPWSELREESLYRGAQNSACMDTLFDHHSIASLAQWLQQWHSISLDGRSYGEQEIAAEQTRLESKMKHWCDRRETFTRRYETLNQQQQHMDMTEPQQEQEKMDEVRRQVWKELEGQIPVPLAPRKRTHNDTPYFEMLQPTSKRQAK